jgi:hypothetical protein
LSIDVKNGFELTRKDSQEMFVVLCDTADMKREWIRNIKNIVKEYQKAEYHANKDRMLRGTCIAPSRSHKHDTMSTDIESCNAFIDAESREAKRQAFRALTQTSAEPAYGRQLSSTHIHTYRAKGA